MRKKVRLSKDTKQIKVFDQSILAKQKNTIKLNDFVEGN